MIVYGLAFLYGLVAFVCLAVTLLEGAVGPQRGWDAMRLAGLALALFWPLIIAILFFSSPRGVRMRRALAGAAGTRMAGRSAARPVNAP